MSVVVSPQDGFAKQVDLFSPVSVVDICFLEFVLYGGIHSSRTVWSILVGLLILS